MAAKSLFGSLIQRVHAPEDLVQQTVLYSILSIIVVLITVTFNSSKPYPKEIPLINPSTPFSLFDFGAKRAFVTGGKTILASARALYPKQPFRMILDRGETLILPPELADEIRNHPHLSLRHAMLEDFHLNLPGFRMTADGYEILHSVIQNNLKQPHVTTALSEEASHALSINIDASEDWQELAAQPLSLDIVTRLSLRVFLGDELCRDEDQLRVAKEWATNISIAAAVLRLAPPFSRKVVHWVLPHCRRLRAQKAEARRMINAVLEGRRRTKQASCAGHRPFLPYNDAIEWAEKEAKTRNVTFDQADIQLGVSLAAINTTGDLLEQVMLDLAQHPKIFQPLREEIVRCLRGGGWTNTSMYDMRLLDSVIKESQRMKPISMLGMARKVGRDIQLSTGLQLRKGIQIRVDMYRMWDPELHKDPDQWDGYRFLNFRTEVGKGPFAQLVSTSPDHLAFGHGSQACPGRFFAANLLKVALSHLLLKYDWKLAPGTNTTPMMFGVVSTASPTARLLIRRRDMTELDINAI